MEKLYKKLCNKKSDINEHLPTLKKYAEQCESITELGVRRGTSTCALLYGKPKQMQCYDIEQKGNLPLKEYEKFAYENDINFKFIIANVLHIEIDYTDLLFIDTLHTYNQLKQELSLHGNKALKYIIFHDTKTFGEIGEDKKSPGLLKAIEEFLSKNSHWSVKEAYKNNNGLFILVRS